MNRGPLLVAVFAFLLSGAGAAWAERLLFIEGDTQAMLAAPYVCGQPVIVTIESGRPELFQSDAPELQRLVDGVRAILAFECPPLREIEIQGRLKGMATTLYRGVATRESGWRLDTLESIRSEADREAAEAAVAETPVAKTGLEIAGLDTGMTVDEARAAVQQAFGGEPNVDAGGVMTFEAGGCPAGYDPAADKVSPKPGWKCLRGWFSRDAQPRLYRLELVQVTEHASAEEVAGLLEARFGPADARWLEARDSGGLWGGEREVVYLAWGGVVTTTPVAGGRPRPSYELEAAVDRVEGLAVTVLTRSTGDSVPPDAAPAATGKTDLKL